VKTAKDSKIAKSLEFLLESECKFDLGIGVPRQNLWVRSKTSAQARQRGCPLRLPLRISPQAGRRADADQSAWGGSVPVKAEGLSRTLLEITIYNRPTIFTERLKTGQ
jgi:hypothetical protein